MKISIIIPSYNGRQTLSRNLPAVVAACQQWQQKGHLRGKKDWEIILVDDASTDDSVVFVKKKFPMVRILRNENNLRFAGACNMGVKKAKGEIGILLNNDVSPHLNFIDALVLHFKDEEVFAVGCREKNKVGGKIIYGGRSLGGFKRGFLVHWRAKNQQMDDTLWASGGSMAFDRQKWLELEGMDTIYRPAYYEDIDLSWRARGKGWKVVFEPKAVVDHNHETTNLQIFGQKEMKVIAYKNQFLFVWKNADLKMLAEHIAWLPFHFIKTISSGDMQFSRGFIEALQQLPELIRKRFGSREQHR